MAAYRDESASLEERHRTLREALDANRARSTTLAKEEADLHQELANLHRDLAKKPKRQLPLANTVLASPCDVPWDSMVGNNRVRHCASCAKDVHNLSAMTEEEVQVFLDTAMTNAVVRGVALPCVALYQRVDGTILTEDCPVGVRRRRMRSLLAATMGLGAAAVIAFTALAINMIATTGSLSVDDFNPFSSAKTRVYHEPLPSPSSVVVVSGYVQFEGDAGVRVYEGAKYLGTGPMTLTMTPGTHVFRVESTDGHFSRSIMTIVKERDIAHVYVTFATPPPTPVMAGGLGEAPVPVPGGMGMIGSPTNVGAKKALTK